MLQNRLGRFASTRMHFPDLIRKQESQFCRK
jgi:hypothetical protein